VLLVKFVAVNFMTVNTFKCITSFENAHRRAISTFFFQYTRGQGQRLMIMNGDKWKNLVTYSFLLSPKFSERLGKAKECPLKSLCSYV
jgi:hypothetical protein